MYGGIKGSNNEVYWAYETLSNQKEHTQHLVIEWQPISFAKKHSNIDG